MKSRTLLLSLPLLFLLLPFTGCKKDIRDKYTGTWEFATAKVVCLYNNSSEVISRDTVHYFGKISSGNEEYRLIIQFAQNEEISSNIGQDGVLWLTYPTRYSTCHRCPIGEFEKTKRISMNFYRFFEDNNIHFAEVYHIIGSKKGKK